MGKATGFLEYPREEPGKRPCEERIQDWDEIRLPQDPESIRVQGARCMDCGIPFCHGGAILNGMVSGCPLHNLIPEWNHLVYEGQWEEAYQRLARTNPFPEFTARVCPAPCEGACTEGQHWEPVAINSIEYAIIEKAWEEGWVRPANAIPSGRKVAVVGSGPAGLAAAHYLNAVGHQVLVIEAEALPGGLLRYGIPSMKLDKKVIDRRIELMKASGISFLLNTRVGLDLPAREVVEGYDAVLLCTGAWRPRDLQLEGRELQGIHFALDYLRGSAGNEPGDDSHERPVIDARGRKVIIIGGGDTGTDCVATAIRQGCKSVQQLEIMPRPPERRDLSSNPWPEWPREFRIDYGQAEAICVKGFDPRRYATSARCFEGSRRGQVKAVHTVDVDWVADETGAKLPEAVPGSEKSWPCDLVLLALGFAGPEEGLLEELKLNRDERGNAQADYGVFETNVDKVFAAGDLRRGQSLVVWAMQEGKLAAREIDRFLTGRSAIK